MSRPLRVELLCLGDELLLGLRLNSHLRLLGSALSAHGLRVCRSHELPDEPALIREAFSEVWGRCDLVITTGGLGPTLDDRTRETVAEVLGRKLIHDEAHEAWLRAFFAQRGAEMTANNLRQCALIEGAEVLPNPHGTAPGQWLEAEGRVLVMLPGPPRELEPMWREQVLPRLIARGWARPRERFLQLRTMGIGESLLASRLEPIIERHPGVQVAYCADAGSVDVRLSSLEGTLGEEALNAVGEEMREALGDDFSHFGEADVAAVIVQQLRERGRKLAVAESCTGGLLSSRFTDVPGVSRVYLGGVVCYRNEVKEDLLGVPDAILRQHGAVSPEAAVALATGASELFEADYALAVTGYAGPAGGREPPGTIYIGLASPMGVWCRKVMTVGDRETVKVRGVNAALDFLRRKMRQYEVHDFLDRLCVHEG